LSSWLLNMIVKPQLECVNLTMRLYLDEIIMRIEKHAINLMYKNISSSSRLLEQSVVKIFCKEC
jgi:hypothetical protein